MKIVVNVERRYVFGFVGLLVLVCGMIGVYAYGSNVSPFIMGHTTNEINFEGGINKINVGLYCDINGNNCISILDIINGINGEDEVVVSILDLVYGLHSTDQCTALGGVLVMDGSNKFCRFSSAGCPSGWASYKSWTRTIATTGSCIDGRIDQESQDCRSSSKSCTTSRHSWSNTARESCTIEITPDFSFEGAAPYCGTCPRTVSATNNLIGCY